MLCNLCFPPQRISYQTDRSLWHILTVRQCIRQWWLWWTAFKPGFLAICDPNINRIILRWMVSLWWSARAISDRSTGQTSCVWWEGCQGALHRGSGLTFAFIFSTPPPPKWLQPLMRNRTAFLHQKNIAEQVGTWKKQVQSHLIQSVWGAERKNGPLWNADEKLQAPPEEEQLSKWITETRWPRKVKYSAG